MDQQYTLVSALQEITTIYVVKFIFKEFKQQELLKKWAIELCRRVSSRKIWVKSSVLELC